jgi:hypothetical protein
LPQKCQACTHPEALSINEALVIDKGSNRGIARQFGLDHHVIERHRRHIPELLLQASRSREIADADLLLDDIVTIRAKTFRALDEAERFRDWNTVLKAIREARENVRILGELHGKLGARVETRPLISPVAMQVIVQVLAPYPELAQYVAEALEPLEELEAPKV